MKIDNEVRKNLLNWLIGLCFILVIAFCCGFSEDKPPKNYEKIETTYIVKSGDTLYSISTHFVELNNYGKRDWREFAQGIIDLNIDQYPEIRYGHIYPNQELKITYWIKSDERGCTSNEKNAQKN